MVSKIYKNFLLRKTCYNTPSIQADSSNDSNNYCPPGPSHASYEFPEAEQSGAQQSRDPGPGPSGVQQSSDQNTNVTPFNLSPLPELSPDTDVSTF